MTYLQDLFVTVPKVLPILFHTFYNLSLKTVIPLYKKNSKLEPGNYRPVSILSTLSKILERAVHIQLEIYLKENDLFLKF